MSKPIFTIDTDNAIIRLYRERTAYMELTTLQQLHRDLTTITQALTDLTNCEFTLVVVR